MKDRGFIIDGRRTLDWQFGGVTGIQKEVLRADGQWDSYLPKFEGQRRDFETYACVSFSALNCVETLMKLKYGKERNFSDRYTAKMSGTSLYGNTFYNVAESIRKDGLLDEAEWEWESPRETYYKEITQKLQDKSKDIYKTHRIAYEFVWDTIDSLQEALRYAPLQIGCHAYGRLRNGIYERSEKRPNHAMMLYGYEKDKYWKVYDHYDNLYKKLAWNTKFAGALKYHVSKTSKPIDMPKLKLPENSLIQLVESPGGFGLYSQGKLYIDDLAKILASWEVRNGGKTDGRTAAITKKDWDSLKKYTLKNEQII